MFAFKGPWLRGPPKGPVTPTLSPPRGERGPRL